MRITREAQTKLSPINFSLTGTVLRDTGSNFSLTLTVRCVID